MSDKPRNEMNILEVVFPISIWWKAYYHVVSIELLATYNTNEKTTRNWVLVCTRNQHFYLIWFNNFLFRFHLQSLSFSVRLLKVTVNKIMLANGSRKRTSNKLCVKKKRLLNETNAFYDRKKFTSCGYDEKKINFLVLFSLLFALNEYLWFDEKQGLDFKNRTKINRKFVIKCICGDV